MIPSSLRNITNQPFWQSHGSAHELPTLTGHETADLLVVGGGFTGLWTCIEAKLSNPDLDVLLIEASCVGGQASGRNGGFIHASLTHGFENGLARWPQDYPLLHALGDQNLTEIRQFVQQHDIQCDWHDTGELELAARPHERNHLQQLTKQMQEFNPSVSYLDEATLRERINSPRYIGALYDPTGVATMNPTQLAEGLSRVALSLGVRVFENSRMTALEEDGDLMRCVTSEGLVHARRTALAINAFRSPFASIRRRIAPVYDYSLVTRPLTDTEWQQVGWNSREGAVEASNLFCYFRRTSDGRILWGGYDAVHHFNSRLSPSFETSYPAYERQVNRFFAAFPQLEGVEFEFGWGGAIDTSTRFTPFWQTHADGKVASCAGFTGLGVGSSRFAARVMFAQLFGTAQPGLETEMVRTLPHPFPPEPFKSIGIQWTQRSLAKADNNGGKRDLLLRTLDRLGIGFDS